MEKIAALREIIAMWTWLYKHPAHDRAYYMTHVAKLETPWRNDCPICSLESDVCPACPLEEDDSGPLCTNPESPLQKWKATATNNPDFRTLYSGEIVALAQKALGHLATAR